MHFISSNSNDIIGNSISFNLNGIYLYRSSEGDSHKLENNLIWNNTNAGVYIDSSNSNYFGYNNTRNIIWNNSYGFYITSTSTDNYIQWNNITTNVYGIYIATADCMGNKIWSNNFINNTLHNDSQAWDVGNNQWFYNTEGNYWSDHNSTDPYTIQPVPPGNQDVYPRTTPV